MRLSIIGRVLILMLLMAVMGCTKELNIHRSTTELVNEAIIDGFGVGNYMVK